MLNVSSMFKPAYLDSPAEEPMDRANFDAHDSIVTQQKTTFTTSRALKRAGTLVFSLRTDTCNTPSSAKTGKESSCKNNPEVPSLWPFLPVTGSFWEEH